MEHTELCFVFAVLNRLCPKKATSGLLQAMADGIVIC